MKRLIIYFEILRSFREPKTRYEVWKETKHSYSLIYKLTNQLLEKGIIKKVTVAECEKNPKIKKTYYVLTSKGKQAYEQFSRILLILSSLELISSNVKLLEERQ